MSLGDCRTTHWAIPTHHLDTLANTVYKQTLANYCMGARHYNPLTMRFITADPSGFDGGINWYLYTGGNPLSNVDANGKTFKDNMSFLYDFIMGTGETNRYYDQNHHLTQEFINSPAGRYIVNAFYEGGGVSRSDITYGTYRAAFETLFLFDNVSMQVGGYGNARTINNNKTRLVLIPFFIIYYQTKKVLQAHLGQFLKLLHGQNI